MPFGFGRQLRFSDLRHANRLLLAVQQKCKNCVLSLYDSDGGVADNWGDTEVFPQRDASSDGAVRCGIVGGAAVLGPVAGVRTDLLVQLPQNCLSRVRMQRGGSGDAACAELGPPEVLLQVHQRRRVVPAVAEELWLQQLRHACFGLGPHLQVLPAGPQQMSGPQRALDGAVQREQTGALHLPQPAVRAAVLGSAGRRLRTSPL